VGLVIGVILGAVGAGAVLLAGGSLSRSPRFAVPLGSERRRLTMLLFGVAYGIASLGCALPLFLALVGSSLGSDGANGRLVVFLAFGAGVAVTLVALSLAAALAREGLATRLRRFAPYVGRVAGALLLLAGVYVAYYWLRLEYGSRATLASDPVVGFGTRFTARLQVLAGREGRFVLLAAAVIVAVGVCVACWQLLRRREGVRVAPRTLVRDE
jgi:cytochrome c-type biogenesis protein